MADRTNFIEAHEILMLAEKIGVTVYPTVMRGPFKTAMDALEALTGEDKEVSFARISFTDISTSQVTEGDDVSEDMAAAWLNKHEPDPENDDVPAYVEDTEALEAYAEEWHIESGFNPIREYGTYNATAL
ncbi:hypothetical protein JET14_13460 [Martelella lutilitoris]|uniref:Uncharacterized protein n=1 Tax=Martelella lutilitoris TaxID=2583532 RepID=A0A7T7KK70_9HYPH|nr:hypothetical protein [Martelella lutilitoris]QQM29331.1 hypothetical protein JET14_13460 [Martelella lutilitoris]